MTKGIRKKPVEKMSGFAKNGSKDTRNIDDEIKDITTENKTSKKPKDRMEELLPYFQEFTLLDDTFMSKCFEDLSSIELVFRIVLKDYDLRLISVWTQHEIRNLQGRSIRMDARARDINNTEYCLEVERRSSRAIPKRARYNGSLMDANITEPGEGYEELKKTTVIFITEKDVLKGKKPIYHITKKIEETNTPFGDEAHIIYVNASIQDNTPLGKLMHDFHCKNADEMYYKKLSDRVRYLKETKEGKQEMCEIMEKLERKAEERGKQIGKQIGVETGQQKINTLNLKLKEDGRIIDLMNSISDTVFQQKLLAEYGL